MLTHQIPKSILSCLHLIWTLDYTKMWLWHLNLPDIVPISKKSYCSHFNIFFSMLWTLENEMLFTSASRKLRGNKTTMLLFFMSFWRTSPIIQYLIWSQLNYTQHKQMWWEAGEQNDVQDVNQLQNLLLTHLSTCLILVNPWGELGTKL